MSVQDSMKAYMRDIGKIPLINVAEEKRLAKLIEKGDKDALELLIKSNLRLVVKIAHDYKGIGLPLAYFQQGGGTFLVVAVLVVFSIVQLIESYLLTPKIMGQRTGLHPLAIMVAIFFWGSALQGILGMILAIPLTAFLVVFWRLAREKYIGELV